MCESVNPTSLYVRPPSPPAYGGCQQVAREECVKVPVVEVRRVPPSSCLPVTDVLCYNVLTPVKDEIVKVPSCHEVDVFSLDTLANDAKLAKNSFLDTYRLKDDCFIRNV